MNVMDSNTKVIVKQRCFSQTANYKSILSMTLTELVHQEIAITQ